MKHLLLVISLLCTTAGLAVNPPTKIERAVAKALNNFEQGQGQVAAKALDSICDELLQSPDSTQLNHGFDLGLALRKGHQYEAANQLYEALVLSSEAAKDSTKMCRALYYAGLTARYIGLLNRALDHQFKCLEVAVAIGNQEKNCQALIQVGVVKKIQGQLEESIEYFELALEESRTMSDNGLAASIYNNIGSAHKKRGDYAEAKEYFLKAIDINKRMGNKKNLSYNYNNLANIYEESNDLDKALEYQKRSLALKQDLNDAPSLATTYSNLSLIYEKRGDINEAKQYAEKAIEIAETYKVASILPIALAQSAKLEAQLGNHKAAYEEMKKMDAFKDSISSLDREAIIHQMEAKYQRQKIVNENELLKRDIELSEAENSRKNTFLVVLGICIAMLIMVVVLYFLSYKSRLEANATLLEQNQAILNQKKRIEQQKKKIEESTAHLDQVRKDKEVFFSTISHDMRGPLNAISAIVSILKSEPDRKDSEEIMVLDYSARALTGLVEDILDFSNLESGRLQIEQRAFSLNELVEEISTSFQFISNEKDIDLIVSAEPIPAKLLGDPKRLGQILFNLLGNAFKFTKDGFVKLEVCHQMLDDGYCELNIVVEDTGIGIPEHKIDVIFNKFAQANTSIYRDFGGSGLGLFISKTLLDQMNGVIQVESKVGEGTRFDITLPLPLAAQI